MSGGVGTGLEEAMEQVGDGRDLVQSALFEELDASEIGALDAPSPLSGALTPRRAGPGRPKGSKNRRTEAVAAWLLSQHRHPLAVMMEAYSMTPAQLAERIGLRKSLVKETRRQEVAGGIVEVEVEVETAHYSNDVLLDILKLQVRMAEAVAPYVAQKLPQAVQVDAKGAFMVAFDGVSLPARGGAAGNSGVIEGQAMAVNLPFKSDDQSRIDVQPPENKEQSP